METTYTDVLIVGTGFGGAAPAMRLARKGINVLMLEKGPELRAPSDFRQTQDPKYVSRYLKTVSSPNVSMMYAEALGGGSGFYAMVSLRAPSIAFEQVDDNGRRLWPAGIDRSTMDPYYDVAESMLKVQQMPEDRVPRTGLVFSLMMKRLGYSCDRARYAVQGCVDSGFCMTGCTYGAKQSLHFNYLPEATAAGAKIECGVEAVSIRPLPALGEADGSRSLAALPYRYELSARTADGDRRAYRAKLIILAGGTVGTAHVLLRSREEMRHLSRHVGRNAALNGGVKVAGLLGPDLPDGDMFTGPAHPGMISYEFLESHGITVAAVKPFPLEVMATARIRSEDADAETGYWGMDHVGLMKQYRRRMMILFAAGLTSPNVTFRLVGKELRVELEDKASLSEHKHRVEELLHSIFVRNGCRPIEAEFVNQDGESVGDPFLSTAHQIGSCRMAETVEDGVADSSGEVFNYPGLFISCGAAIPSSLAVNTSLTVLANAERVADILTQRYSA